MIINLEEKARDLAAHAEDITKLEEALQPHLLRERLHKLEEKSYEEEFWQDVDKAQKVQKEISRLSKTLSAYSELKEQYEELQLMLELAAEENSPEFFKEIEKLEKAWREKLDNLTMQTYFREELDENNAILTLHAGAGGTEACDWCEMLFRMYARWAEQASFSCEVLNSIDGDEAGLKSVTFKISGDFAYGMLKMEKGVHRLVRISPFDSSGRRHTSFASLEVLPELDKTVEIEINPDDLRVDYYRSSGAGGQHVNKTSSAVRITHLPTNIVVACQNERSQMQNREVAMAMLKAKLYTLAREKQLEKIEDLKGEQKDISWGSQIRSYVFCPYTLVKDNRTNLEIADIDEVMDGGITPFIMSMLAQNAARKKREEGDL